MRFLNSLILFAIVAVGTYLFWNHTPYARDFFERVFDSGEFLTLEAHYSAEDIMKTNKNALLLSEQHKFLKPTLQFYPYLFLEVKYNGPQDITEEGVVLWGQNDGEMVLDTETWETTHGFEDCLNANADANDYKIISALAQKKDPMDRESLLKALHVEPQIFDQWINQSQGKQLIVQRGNDYRLHFEKPKLEVRPNTYIRQRLVTKPYKHAMRMGKKYSKSQITSNARAAFGQHFAVRKHHEVYLPVYSIDVQNPDGSVATTLWNALNGKQLKSISIKSEL